MPIIIEGIEQGTPEWRQLRLGIPTASKFDEIVTTKGVPSKSAKNYMRILAGERITGELTENKKFGSMQKGNDREQEARDYYQFVTDQEVHQVAVVYLDEKRKVGASPDGLIGHLGGFENKNAEPHIQITRYEEGWSSAEHFQQVQGSLWICAREWWDLQSYCRGTKSIIVRFHRDEAFISRLSVEVEAFNQELDAMIKKWSA